MGAHGRFHLQITTTVRKRRQPSADRATDGPLHFGGVRAFVTAANALAGLFRLARKVPGDYSFNNSNF